MVASAVRLFMLYMPPPKEMCSNLTSLLPDICPLPPTLLPGLPAGAGPHLPRAA